MAQDTPVVGSCEHSNAAGNLTSQEELCSMEFVLGSRIKMQVI
jgi:hypothetical protein